MRRRALLAVAATATSVTTGCLDTDTDDGTPGSTDDTPTPTDGAGDGTSTGDDDSGSADDDGDDAAGDDDGVSEDDGSDDADDSGGNGDSADDADDGPGDDDGSDGDDDPGDDGENETPEPTPGETRLVDREMVIHGNDCGSGANHYEVDVDDGVVTVDGTIRGYNSCYTARIDESDYDGSEDVLHVVVESFDDSDGTEMCAECIVDVEYEATFYFENGEPGDVSVEHDD